MPSKSAVVIPIESGLDSELEKLVKGVKCRNKAEIFSEVISQNAEILICDMKNMLGNPIFWARERLLAFDAFTTVQIEFECEHILNFLKEHIEFDCSKLLSVAIRNHRNKLVEDFDEYAEFYCLQDYGNAYGRAECSPDWPI